MQAVIYARCSTRSQALGHSIVRQIDGCTQFAKANGYTIVGVFVDIASRYVGPLPQRTAAVKRASTTGTILVEDLDRWGPLPEDLGDVSVVVAGIGGRQP